MPIQIFITRVLVALACGFFIGLERQWHHKRAGIRTNSLVALGSAIFVLLSFELIQEHGGDITRIIGQIVTGVGFLCAGVIMHQGLNVQGLTTAATIWCSAAVGCIAAAGYYAEAVVCAVLIVVINSLLKYADRWINNRVKEIEEKDYEEE